MVRSHTMYLCLQESTFMFICEMWLFNLFFLNSANLICQGMDISKYFRESLVLRDNDSQLYIRICFREEIRKIPACS